MAEQQRNDHTSESGISHFPLEEEQARQDKVDEKASAQAEAPPSAGSRREHLLSRENDPQRRRNRTSGSRAGEVKEGRREDRGRVSFRRVVRFRRAVDPVQN